jgi:hypothetical protein
MVRLYADECVKGSIVRGLRERGVDILTVQEDGLDSQPDPLVLGRATALGRILFSQDDDLLVEAARRQRDGISFSGVIFAHQKHVTVGVCIEHLSTIAGASEPEEYMNRVEYLPL